MPGPGAPRFDRVLVLARVEKPGVQDLLVDLQTFLAERVGDVLVEPDVSAFFEGARGKPPERPDLVVVLGGDGMLLGAASVFAEHPVPILGINFGRVGFLASTPAGRWHETLEAVFEGRGRLEHRKRLRVRWTSRGHEREAVALNDLVVQRGSHQGMLTLALKVGEDWVTSYRADGLIVATPSGSTAYSLSAGGPIVAPSVPGIVVTPICSQGLSNRPLVLSDDEEVQVVVSSSSGVTTLAIDGQSHFPLALGEVVRLARHPEDYPVLAMPDLDPYRRLRSRLGWRGTVEPHELFDDGPPAAGDPLPPDAGEGGRY